MIRPFRQGDDFLTDVAVARNDPEKLHLWWLGQSGYLLQHRGKHLLMDPYLSDSLTRKYAGTDKPHVRMTERVVDPRQLDFIDLVTSSHSHTDHLDAETLIPLFEVNPRLQLVFPEAIRELVKARLGCDDFSLIGLDDGEAVELEGFRFAAVASAHENLERDDQGRHRFLGYVVKGDSFTVYHSGDCVPYPGLARRLRGYRIDAAMLPINGRAVERRVPGNMSGEEAAELASNSGIGLVTPCHFEMFEFNTVTPEGFERACRKLRQPYFVLRAGQRLSL